MYNTIIKIVIFMSFLRFIVASVVAGFLKIIIAVCNASETAIPDPAAITRHKSGNAIIPIPIFSIIPKEKTKYIPLRPLSSGV